MYNNDAARDLGKTEIESRVRFAERQVEQATKFASTSTGAFAHEYAAFEQGTRRELQGSGAGGQALPC